MGFLDFVKDVTGISLVEDFINAPKEAAATQAQAAADAGNLEYSQYLQTREDLLNRQAKYEQGAATESARFNPYIKTGTVASDRLGAYSGLQGPQAQADAYANYQESPGVAFLREQGMRGLEQNLNASGVGGGTRLKAISRFNQGLATQDFNNQYNRLAAQSDIGRAALSDSINTNLNALSGGIQTATDVGKLGAASAANRADALNSAGAYNASGQLGQQNQLLNIASLGLKTLSL